MKTPSISFRAGLALLFLSACQSPDSPEGGNVSPVVGTWKGRFEAKDFKIFVKMKMTVAADHSYLVSGTPEMTGMDSLVVYEEVGNWEVKANLFIANKSSCSIIDQLTGKLKPDPCPPPDSAAIDIAGDTLWTAKIRGELLALSRVR